MAQKYNPSTGQWEEEEDESSLTSGSAAAFGGGSAPVMDGSSMTAGVPQFSNGAFSNPSYNLNTLPEGYGWEAPEGSTKSYKDPWDTSFDYLGADGTSLGRGYDDYATAIKKLSFNSGASYTNPTPESATWDPTNGEQGSWGISPATGGWAYNTPRFDGYSPDYGTDQLQLASGFDSKQALYDHLLSQPGGPLSYDSREKYGRPLIEGQLQNMYSLYASGALKGGVPDWTYHREAYYPNQATAGTALSGDAAMVGSTPLFGSDGKVLGYKSNLNPEHLRFADTSGRVTSSTYGDTTVDPEVQKILRGIDGNNAFINAGDTDKFGYKSFGSSSYNKEDSAFGGLMKKLVPMAIMAAGAYGLGGAGAAAGAGEGAALGSGLTAGGGLGMTAGGGLGLTGEIAGLGSMGFGGSIPAAMAGAGGLGLEGLSGIISDLGASFPGAFGDMAGGAVSDLASSIASNPFGGGLGELISSLSTPNSIPGFDNLLTDQVASPSFSQGADALSNVSPEYAVPDSYSSMDGFDPFSTTEEVNKGFNKLTGYGMNDPYGKGISGLPTGTEGEIKNMYNFMTQSPGKAGMFKAPSPLEMLYKGGKAFMDYNSNQDAMDMYKSQLDKVSNYQDPNRARGDTANQLWQQNFQDPMAGYKDFMMGGGRDFIDKARAQAAASGKRGSYINSGKMNSDLASMYMKQQLSRGDALTRGFEKSPNNAENTMKYAAPMMDMERNKYAPFGQAIDSIMRGFQLSDLFGG